MKFLNHTLNKYFFAVFVMSLIGLLPVSNVLKAADLIDYALVHNKMLMLHFSDGYIKYAGYHQSADQEVIVNNPLDTLLASKYSSYMISSKTDENYLVAKSPVKIGRKRKPVFFSNQCNWVNNKCDNVTVSDNYVYLMLPEALTPGEEYTVWVGDLAENMDEITFVFTKAGTRSEAIHVNQIGYVPTAGKKFAYISQWAGDLGPLSFDNYSDSKYYIADYKTGNIVYTSNGAIQLRRSLASEQTDNYNIDQYGPFNNYFGADVWECDFSDFNTPGEYVLYVEGIGCSYPFKIEDDIYREAYYHVARSLYFQRAGIAREQQYAGKWAQPRDHHPADGFELNYSKYPSIISGEGSTSKDDIIAQTEQENITDWGWGWYHDAGDWDGYSHHAVVPQYLMAAFEVSPEKFTDNELNIPESGNGIPDILDEAGWLINYYRRNIQPSGAVAGGRVSSDWNSKPENSPSYEDNRPWYLSGEDPYTTFYFAGLAAQYAYCLELAGNTDQKADLIAEAKAAYQWANENKTPEGKNIKGQSYDDLKMYAAATLYKVTGEEDYQTVVKNKNKVSNENAGLKGGGFNQTWAVYAYITSPDYENIDDELKQQLMQATVNYGKNLIVESARQRSGRNGGDMGKPPVVGSTTTPVIADALYAWKFAEGETKQELMDYMYTTCDYFLGGNSLNMTWISGVGDKAPKRYLKLDARYHKNTDEYHPGFIPYGPLRHGDHFNGEDAQGPWDADYAKIRSYPDRYDWPIAETWFDNPFSVLDGEYTVHQNCAPGAAAYGFLCAASQETYTPNQKPVIQLTTSHEGTVLNEQNILTVNVTPTDDEWVAKVEYYLGWHKIAETTQSPFNLEIAAGKLIEGEWKLSARAIDNEGAVGKSNEVDITIAKDFIIDITSPTETTGYTEGDPLEVTVEVPEFSDVTLSKVILYQNGQEAGETKSKPYTISIEGLYPRDVLLEAVAVFEEGFQSTPAKKMIFVTPKVKDVEIKKKEIEVHLGEYQQLTADVIPFDAANTNVTWRSENTDIATIDANGVVSPVAMGEVDVEVKTEDGGFTDKCHVTVLEEVPQGPYYGTPMIIPGKIEVEDYDFGGEGRAYHDKSPGNSKGAYRFDGVDIEKTWDLDANAYTITEINDNEWAKYTIYIAETNTYNVVFRITNGMDDGKIKLYIDDEPVTDAINLPNVGWWPYKDFVVEDVELPKGKHVLKWEAITSPFTLNFIDFQCDNCTSIPPTSIQLSRKSAVVSVGGTLQLTAQVLPENTSNKKVYWHSTDDAVAYVDNQGNVTALSSGEAQVIASTEEIGLTDTCRIKVAKSGDPINGVQYEYYEGEWEELPDFNQLDVIKKGITDGFNIDVATAEDNFAVRFTATISIATAGEYVFYTASDDGSKLYINRTEVVNNDGLHASVEQGGSIELIAGEHEIVVTYFEKGGGNTLIVLMEGQGMEKQNLPGSMLHVTATGGQDLISLTGIALQPNNIELDKKQVANLQVNYTPQDASDKKVTFLSDNEDIATINQYGEIIANKPGTCTITATARDGNHQAKATVKVNGNAPAVEITKPTADQEFYEVDEIAIEVSAADADNDLLLVKFFAGDEFLGDDIEAPYQFVWTDAEPGNYNITAEAFDATGLSTVSEIVSIVVNEGNNIHEIHSRTAIHVYPNPATQGCIFLKLNNIKLSEDANLELTDIDGKTIRSEKANLLKHKGDVYELNVSELQQGIYFIMLHNSHKKYQTKILIE